MIGVRAEEYYSKIGNNEIAAIAGYCDSSMSCDERLVQRIPTRSLLCFNLAKQKNRGLQEKY